MIASCIAYWMGCFREFCLRLLCCLSSMKLTKLSFLFAFVYHIHILCVRVCVCVYTFERVIQWMRIETKGISSISHFILFRHRWQNLQAFHKWICLNRTWFDYQLRLFLPFLHFKKKPFPLVRLCRVSKHESNARGSHMWESVTTLTVRWHKHEPFHMFYIRNGNTNRTCTENHTKRGRSKNGNNSKRSHTFAPIYLFSRTNSLNHNYSSFIWVAFDERSVYIQDATPTLRHVLLLRHRKYFDWFEARTKF